MTFANPLLLLLAPVLMAMVVLLHARRRRDLPVASLVVWRRTSAEISAAPARRRISWRDPRLWIQLLAVAAAVLALAGPTTGGDGRTVHWIVVIDASTSMNALDAVPSRFDAAVATIRERWGGAVTPGQVSIVRAGATVEVVAAGWRTGSGLEAALDRLAPGEGSADWAASAERVRTLKDIGDDVRVIVLSDAYGVEDARTALEASGSVDVRSGVDESGGLGVVVFGDALVNVGIGQVSATPRGDRADQWFVRGRVETVGFESGETVRVVAAYRPFGGDTFLPWGGTDVTLERDGAADFEMPLDLPGPGELEIRGPTGDRLPVDDRAAVVLRPEPVRVAIVGPREPALLRALAAIGDLDVFAAETIPDPEAARAFDLVIVTGDVEGVPATSTLWLGVVPDGVEAGEPLQRPLPALAVGGHRLVQDLDPGAMDLDRAIPLVLLAGSEALVTADDAVLAWARTTNVGRQVVVGFGPADGDWPAQLSFPAFVASVVDWATPRAWSHASGGCSVGESCPWPREAFEGGWLLRDPTGKVVVEAQGPDATVSDPLATAAWEEAWFDAGYVPQRSGRYELVLADGVLGLPTATVPIGGEPVASSSVGPAAAVPVARDLARWFAAVALTAAIADALLGRSAWKRGARRRAWFPLVLSVAATGSWLLAVVGAPLPTAVAGGNAVWVGAGDSDDAAAAATSASRDWSWSRVRVRPVGSDAEPETEAPAGVRREIAAPDVATAIELALALPDGGGARRVVVDTSAVRSVSASQWRALVTRADALGVVVDVVGGDAPLGAGRPGAAGADAEAPSGLALDRVLLPNDVRAGSRYTLRAAVRAPDTVAWRWTAELVAQTGASPEADAESLAPALEAPPEPTVSAEALGTGSGLAELDLQAGGAGEVRYRVALWSSDDGVPVAEATVSIRVGGRPKVLLVATDDVQGARLAEGLETQLVEVRTVTPFRMPSSLEALAEYDAVALVNVPASEVFTAYQDMLEQYVRELGGGLVFFGGPTSFGPGGYFRTPLEDLSPLSAQITDEAPEVAMVFVLDRSGSMNGAVGSTTRMDVAKVATLEALALLGEQSQAAVVVFDAEAQVLLPFRSVRDVPAFESALSSVRAAGGTAIFPGLVAAYDLVRASDAATRHVVVMTDGLSQDGDFAGVLGALNELGISTSFVGVGDSADRRQLNTLAAISGGALHYALDFRALPSLLAQEALMLSATPIEERPTQVDWVAGSVPEFLEGVATATPPLLAGYVRTTAKDEADVHLVERAQDDPIFASWRYGLGRVAAFASEADGPWSVAWTQAPEYARLWSQTLRWASERAVRDGWTLDVAGSVGALDVVVGFPSDVEPDDVGRQFVELLGDDGRVLATRPLGVTGPGRAVVRFEVDVGWTGELVVRLAAADGLGLDAAMQRSLSWPPAPVAAVRADALPLERIALLTGGAAYGGGNVSLGEIARLWRWEPMLGPWIMAGLAFFLVALMARYGAWGAWFGGLRRRR